MPSQAKSRAAKRRPFKLTIGITIRDRDEIRLVRAATQIAGVPVATLARRALFDAAQGYLAGHGAARDLHRQQEQ